MKYHKILVKFSGESFGEKGKGIDLKRVEKIVEEIKQLIKAKVKVAIVCGGGNISRWKDVKKGDRVEVDLKGIRGTLKNVYPLAKLLQQAKISCQVYTSFAIKSVYPNFKYQSVKKDWQRNKVLIFAGGTGQPFFTTDTAAVLRALQVGAEIYIKSTKVDGIFTADPVKNPQAKKINRLSHHDYIIKNLKVVDPTAVCLAWENKLPIRVVESQEGNIMRVVEGKNVGSIIK